MSQYRINVFGDLVDTGDLPTMMSNIMSPGRLIGNEFIVAASDFMDITAGSCLLPDGVLVLEDETKSLVIPNSSLATDYTVIYQLEDTRTLGGSPAILRLLSGVKRQEDFTDGTILGWIRYPGGSIPISASFFIQPSHIRITKTSANFYYSNNCPLNAIRPSTTGWTESIDYVLSEACSRFVNTSVLPSNYTLRIPFTIPTSQPRKLITRLLVDFNCLVTFSINLKGTTIALSPNSGLVSNTGTIITREFNIPYSADLVWEPGSTAYIECYIDSQPSRGVSIAYVGLTLEPTPFTIFT
jgi:hypothetical protein